MAARWNRARSSTGGSVVSLVDRVKQFTEPHLDSALALVALNTGAILGVQELASSQDVSEPTSYVLAGITGVGLVAMNKALLRNRPAGRLLTRFNERLSRDRILSWVRTGAFATLAYLGMQATKPYAEPVIRDGLDAGVAIVDNLLPNRPVLPPPADSPSEAAAAGRSDFHALGYTRRVEHNFLGTRLAEKNSYIGRIQRVERWRPIIDAVASKYGLRSNTLAAVVMQESYGDPVQPNGNGDGGLGLAHEQGPTAAAYGLRIHGTSKTSSDAAHGRQLRDLIIECKYDPACVQQYDERAHLIKNLDVAARIIAEGKRAGGTEDAGVMRFRGGRFAATRRNYLARVKQMRTALESPVWRERAADDFQERNGFSVDTYWGRWHAMNGNWGLDAYRAMPRLDGR